MTGHLWAAAGIGAVVGLIVYGVGAPLSRSVGAGAVVILTAFLLLRSVDAGSVEWPDPPPGMSDRVAGVQRWRLNGFDALGDRNPGFSPHLQSRLQALASALLARRRLVPGSPAAVALLGPTTHDLLFPIPLDGPLPDDSVPGQVDPTTGELAKMVERLIALSAERAVATRATGQPEVSLTKGQE